MPASATAEPRSTVIGIRTNSRERARIEAAAREQGITISEFGRTALLSLATRISGSATATAEKMESD